MGCTKCRPKKFLDENKDNEIIYTQKAGNLFKHKSIIDILDSRIDYNNIYQQKEILQDEEIEQLNEVAKKIKNDIKLLRLLKKCQSRIIGMHLRKKVRYENLRRSETMTLDNLLKKDIPLRKDQIESFFLEYPPKIIKENIKIVKSEPIVFANEIIYIGEWDSNYFQRYGRGIQIYPDKSYYKGYWENNKAEGKGEFYHKSGDKYIGNWHDNKRNGKGIYKSKNGMTYDGNWVDDKPDGEGKEEWEDGNTYIGSYSKGKKNGYGKLIMKNGCIYEGNFVDGNMNGKGKYIFNDQRIYEGNFINNSFEGKGTYTWPNGNIYKGYFKNDKRDGFGILYFKDGKKYRGMWNKGRLEGKYDFYNPYKNIWIKRKKKIIYDEEEHKNNNTISEKMDDDDEDEFNVGQFFDDSVIGKIEGIKKNENIEINPNIDEEFKI